MDHKQTYWRERYFSRIQTVGLACTQNINKLEQIENISAKFRQHNPDQTIVQMGNVW